MAKRKRRQRNQRQKGSPQGRKEFDARQELARKEPSIEPGDLATIRATAEIIGTPLVSEGAPLHTFAAGADDRRSELALKPAITIGKDLIDHVRFIHFSLVIACAGLLIAVWNVTDSRFTTAAADLKWLSTAVLSNSSEKQLKEQVFSAAKIVDADETVNVTINGFEGTDEFATPTPSIEIKRELVLGIPKSPPAVDDENGSSERLLSQIKLHDVMTFWDALVPAVHVVKIGGFSSSVYVFDSDAGDETDDGPGDSSVTHIERAVRKLADATKYPRDVRPMIASATNTSSRFGGIVSLDGEREKELPAPSTSVIAAAASLNAEHCIALTNPNSDRFARSASISVVATSEGAWKSMIDRIPIQFPSAADAAISNDGRYLFVASVLPPASRLMRYYVDLYDCRITPGSKGDKVPSIFHFPGSRPLAIDATASRAVWTQEGKRGIRFGKRNTEQNAINEDATVLFPDMRIDALTIMPHDNLVVAAGLRFANGTEATVVASAELDTKIESDHLKVDATYVCKRLAASPDGNNLACLLLPRRTSSSQPKLIKTWKVSRGIFKENLQLTLEKKSPADILVTNDGSVVMALPENVLEVSDSTGRSQERKVELSGEPTTLALTDDPRKVLAFYRAERRSGENCNTSSVAMVEGVDPQGLPDRKLVPALVFTMYEDKKHEFVVPCHDEYSQHGWQIATVNLQNAFNDLDKRSKRAIGPFALAFPELNSFAEEFQGFPVQSLFDHITAESTKPKEQLDVFGIKVAADKVRRVGGGVIVAIQFYLAIHLVQLLRAERGAVDPFAVWIGLYPERVAAAVTVTTACVFPLATIIWVQWDGIRSSSASERVISWIVVVAAVAVALWLAITLRNARERVRMKGECARI